MFMETGWLAKRGRAGARGEELKVNREGWLVIHGTGWGRLASRGYNVAVKPDYRSGVSPRDKSSMLISDN